MSGSNQLVIPRAGCFAVPSRVERQGGQLRRVVAIGRSRLGSLLTPLIDVLVDAHVMAQAAHQRFPSADYY
jgi:hypothetical protein